MVTETESYENGSVQLHHDAAVQWENELLPALKRLDHMLERAIAAAEAVYGPDAAKDGFRGLHLSKQDVDSLLGLEPGAPLLWQENDSKDDADWLEESASRLSWLRETFGLSAFEMDVILIALAPELDLRYERLYAYLQDDVSKKRPTVELVLNLLCGSAQDKLDRRVHFYVDGGLLKHRLIHLYAEPNHVRQPLLAHYLKLDEQIVRLLLGQQGLDTRLAPFCQLMTPVIAWGELPFIPESVQTLRTLLGRTGQIDLPSTFYFQGPRGVGKRQCAETLASEFHAPFFTADLNRAIAEEVDLAQALLILIREALIHNAIVFIEGLDTLQEGNNTHSHNHLLDALAHIQPLIARNRLRYDQTSSKKHNGGQDQDKAKNPELNDPRFSTRSGTLILAGEKAWRHSGVCPIDIIDVPFSLPHFAQRRACWQAGLTARAVKGVNGAKVDVEALADRFRFTPAQISQAVAAAFTRALWWQLAHSSGQSPGNIRTRPTAQDLFTAARSQSDHHLGTLAQKIEAKYTWDDIVLADDAMAQLWELCQRVVHRHRVLGEWGFDRKLSLGKGVNALFAGSSGTGKTMAAEIIANELGLDLYRIDLSGVVSKYIGETEKNLDKIFRAAADANAILFFDEADALFGKRSEVRDSHDRYANIEISYLLQKMEQFEGITILATNLRQNLDEAFTRRLAFMVHFPFPDEASRQQIWAGIWPVETPLEDDVDLDILAKRFKLSGGNIKNIALAAAFLAVEDESPVMMGHLRQAIRREYQKMGKALSEAEVYDSLSNVQSLSLSRTSGSSRIP